MPTFASSKRRPTTLHRMAKISKLYLEGIGQAEIARILGVKAQAVYNAIHALKKEWRESTTMDFSEARDRELARIDHMESVAWEAFEASQQVAQVKITKTGKERRIIGKKLVKTGKGVNLKESEEPVYKMVPVKDSIEIQQKGQTGDPRFLDIIIQCRRDRMKLLALVTDTPHIQNQFVVNWDGLIGGDVSSSLSGVETDPIEAEIKRVEMLPDYVVNPVESGSVMNGVHTPDDEGG